MQAQTFCMHGSFSKSIFFFSHLRTSKGLKEQLPEHLLSRSELSETILVSAVALRLEVHALWCIYYLHNSDTDCIYFHFAPSLCPGMLFSFSVTAVEYVFQGLFFFFVMKRR